MTLFLFALALGLGCIGALPTQAQPAQEKPAPDIQDLGNQRYRIGNIEVDKAAAVFTVPGQILRDEPPLEFLVVTQGGHKAYEAVLEVNADAFQFNLACILIGLDSSRALPRYERNPDEPAQGDPVEVKVRWVKDGKTVTVDGADLLTVGEPAQPVESRDWVYTGSIELSDGRYLADLSGTLVGFVHRDESIIEHRLGIGLGNYGSVSINRHTTPPVGSLVELTIGRLRTDK